MANFSSIKFNNVDYPLKDATARDDIASLQTGMSELDTRVTALEQEMSEGVQVITLDTYYDTLGTTIEGLSDLDYDKPIYLLVRTGQVLSGESGDDTVFAVLDDSENDYTFASQFIKYGESVENKDTPQEVIHKYFYLTSTSGDSFKFSIDPLNNTISGGTKDIPYATQTVILPYAFDYAFPSDFVGLSHVDWSKPIFARGNMTLSTYSSGDILFSSQYIVCIGEGEDEGTYKFLLVDENGSPWLFCQEYSGEDSVIPVDGEQQEFATDTILVKKSEFEQYRIKTEHGFVKDIEDIDNTLPYIATVYDKEQKVVYEGRSRMVEVVPVAGESNYYTVILSEEGYSSPSISIDGTSMRYVDTPFNFFKYPVQDSKNIYGYLIVKSYTV